MLRNDRASVKLFQAKEGAGVGEEKVKYIPFLNSPKGHFGFLMSRDACLAMKAN